MSRTEADLHDFSQFVLQNLSSSGSQLRLAELFDLWLAENQDDPLFAENVEAVNASLNDYRQGERGVLARTSSQRLRQELGLREE